MSSIGGSVQSFTFDGRNFVVAADADVNYDLGGYSNEMQPNGDGKTARIVKSVKVWMVEGLGAVIDDDQADLEFLQERADNPVEHGYTFTITFINNVTYRGKGNITGDVKASTQNKTAPLTFSGAGKLEQQ